MGVVTGITLEFQFGTNWSRYSQYVGDIFGSLLAIEATTSFFLESTFIAVWAFGWTGCSAASSGKKTSRTMKRTKADHGDSYAERCLNSVSALRNRR